MKWNSQLFALRPESQRTVTQILRITDLHDPTLSYALSMKDVGLKEGGEVGLGAVSREGLGGGEAGRTAAAGGETPFFALRGVAANRHLFSSWPRSLLK
jgi:hypothetical protein